MGLTNLEILEILENPQTVEKKGDSMHFLEILENLEIFIDSRGFFSEKTPFVMTPFSGPDQGLPTKGSTKRPMKVSTEVPTTACILAVSFHNVMFC